MKRVNVAGCIMIAAIAMSAAMAGSAAALQWLLDGKSISARVAVDSKALLVFTDLAATGGAVTIECEGTDKGTVGPATHGEITEIKAKHCGFESGKNGACEAEAEVTATALNLPWLSLLLSASGTTTDRLSAEGGKGVGWGVV